MKPERFNGVRIEKSEDQWKRLLSTEQFRVLRGEETECPFTNQFHDHSERGWYACAGCEQALFSSQNKFFSHSGWPSFFSPIFPENVTYVTDNSLGVSRIEVRCSRCGGHLGHVFDDGPLPTGRRFCINSVALKFMSEK